MYGFCVGPRDYAGPLKPRLHPRRLLDGVIEGVKDGGNKSGVPTVGGALYFDQSYLGKCLVFVGAVGLMPNEVKGEPGAEKVARPGDLIFTCGGRVGKDGIHGVTASSEVSVPGHPGRPCPDRRPLHPEEHARFSPGGPGPGPHHLHHRLRRRRAVLGRGGIGPDGRRRGGLACDGAPEIPGLDPWEIWVSESQERMVVAVAPDA